MAHFKIGDLVWGKMGKYPPWPGKIVKSPKDLKKPKGKPVYFVKFFGTDDHAWIKVDQLKSYHLHKDKMMKANKSKRFQHSLDAVEEFIRKKKIAGEASTKRGRRKSEGKLPLTTEKRLSTNLISTPLNTSYHSSFHDYVKPFHIFNIDHREMTTASIQAADTTAANGNVIPTSKRIGFLGLGLVGCGMVQNLLKTGHSVTVWSRTPNKCDIFVQDGAYLGRTPAEVVSTCDITFACVFDPKAAKELVLGPSGVLQGIGAGKCYVDLSTVDPETAQEISQVIISRGGRYLEAPVSGNKHLSEEGLLILLAAGDRTLYDDCISCFQAVSKRSFYLGEVGNAARMTLVLNMILGSFVASLAEGFSLAQHCGLSQQTLLEVLSAGPTACALVEQKGQGILQGDYEPSSSLKHVQKDLRLAIAMGDSLHQQTPMAAAANEMFKKAKALDQSENDMAAVYRVYE